MDATKRAPPPLDAVNRDRPGMRLRDPADDCQAEAGSRAVIGSAVESFEDALPVGRRNAGTVVLDDDFAASPVALRCNDHRRARMAHGVVEQIACEFAQPPFVAVDDGADGETLDANAALARGRSDVARAARYDGRQIDGFALQHALARLAGQRQQVADDRRRLERLRGNLFEGGAHFGGFGAAGRLRDAGDCRQRRTQFVCHVRSEDALAFARRKDRRERRTRERVGGRADSDDERHVEQQDRDQHAPHRGRHGGVAFGRVQRRLQQRRVFPHHERERTRVENREDANENEEIESGSARDQLRKRYPTPQTVSMKPSSPSLRSLRRSWLTYTSTILLEPSKS